MIITESDLNKIKSAVELAGLEFRDASFFYVNYQPWLEVGVKPSHYVGVSLYNGFDSALEEAVSGLRMRA